AFAGRRSKVSEEVIAPAWERDRGGGVGRRGRGEVRERIRLCIRGRRGGLRAGAFLKTWERDCRRRAVAVRRLVAEAGQRHRFTGALGDLGPKAGVRPGSWQRDRRVPKPRLRK